MREGNTKNGLQLDRTENRGEAEDVIRLFLPVELLISIRSLFALTVWFQQIVVAFAHN